MNKRVLQHYKNAQRIIKALSSVQVNKLPYPRIAYLYPTYRCSLNCKNCMYKDHIIECEKKGILDMDLKLFNHILADLSSRDVMNVELCGGGEPLEHKHINGLIEVASEFRRRKGMDFGLLTNGQCISRWDDNCIKTLLECFAYVRMSFSEKASIDSKFRKEYFNNLKRLLEYKKYNNKFKAIIGSKILLTPSNKGEILETVSELLDLGVEHLKVKSIRSKDDELSLADLIEIEEELKMYQTKKSYQDVLKVDLGRTVFPDGFKCWINPLSVTIDSYGGIYICFNFHNDPGNMMIGKYNQNNRLSDFWGKTVHIEKIRHIQTQLVCEAETSCNCRYADYQKMMEEMFRGGKDPYYAMNDSKKIKKELQRINKFF